MRESKKAKAARCAEINRLLAQAYPDARASLDFDSPFQLLVAVVLSARTTDAQVNKVTPELFATYPTPEALAAAPIDDVERILHSIGFFRAKAKSITTLSAQLIENFDGEVPATIEELTTLAGVGRKSANVVLGEAFGIPGITVDTHVSRLSQRMGFTRNTDPVKIEMDLNDLLDPAEWVVFNQRMIFHGRAICTSRAPTCEACPVAGLCPRTGVKKR